MKKLIMLAWLALVSATANALPVAVGAVNLTFGTYVTCFNEQTTGLVNGGASLSSSYDCPWATQSAEASAAPGELHALARTHNLQAPGSDTNPSTGVARGSASFRDYFRLESANPMLSQTDVRITAYLHASFTATESACNTGDAQFETIAGIVLHLDNCGGGTISRTVVTQMLLNSDQEIRGTLYFSAYARNWGAFTETDAANTSWITIEVLDPNVTMVTSSGHDYSQGPQSSVPEPGTFWIAALGLAALLGARRSRA